MTGIEAKGYESDAGFVVVKGSQARLTQTRTISAGVSALRQDLSQNGVLVEKDNSYYFTQDYEFSSYSYAAAVILGRSANGRMEWKKPSV